MSEKKISVIIVNYNVKYYLEQSLYSVRAALYGLDAEIWVVDNNSSDGSVEHIKTRFPEVQFIENKDNPGFAVANNQALKQSLGEYVLLLNPDTVISEDILRTLCFFMDEHPEAGAIGVKMLNGNGVFLPESKRSFPSPWVSFCKLFGLSKLFPNSKLFSAYSLPYLHSDKVHQVEVLSGAFMFIRHNALKQVGFLDESFFMYGEDIDLSYRIIKGRYKNYYYPERILHYKGESTKRGDRKYRKAFYEAMLIFYQKYYPNSSGLINFLIRSSIALRSAYERLFEDKNKSNKPNRARQLLVLSKFENFEKIQLRAKERILGTTHFDLWDLGHNRALNAVNRRFRNKTYTDILFCYPEVSFNQMLLFMDKMTDKKINYHIFHLDNDLLVTSA